MEFIKRHYEKIILGIVLLILGAAAAYLPFALDKEKTDTGVLVGGQTKAKPVAPLNLTTQEVAIAQMKEGRAIVLPERHNVFNPVTWKETPDHKLLKLDSPDKEGPEALKALEIRPLNMVLSFDRATPAGFYVGVLKETVSRTKTGQYVTLNQRVPLAGKTNEFMTIREAKGPPDDPTELVLDLELAGRTEKISISKSTPFKRVEGYEGDFLYPPENRRLLKMQRGLVMTFNDDAYLIIDLKPDLITLKAYSNQKTTTKKWNPAP